MSGSGKEAVRLCEHIVRQAFGDVPCRVASTLLHRGRLSIPVIRHLTALSIQNVEAALLVLLQHNLVQYSQLPSIPNGPVTETYEFAAEECLLRLRWGRILALTEARVGVEAADVIRAMMVHGRMTGVQVQETCARPGDNASINATSRAITNLLLKRFLEPVVPALSVVQSDEVETRFRQNRDNRARDKGGLASLSLTDKQNAQKEAEFSVSRDRSYSRDVKRVLERVDKGKRSKKKAKDKKDIGLDYTCDSHAYLRICYERYGIVMRDEVIVQAVRDRWNDGAAEIMRVILEQVLDNDASLSSATTNTTGVHQIVETLPKELWRSIEDGLGRTSKSISDTVGAYLTLLSGGDLLQRDPSAFLIMENSANKQCAVQVEMVSQKLREQLLVSLVRQRQGDVAARVLATVIMGGKISEQAVKDCAMLSLQVTRSTLTQLQSLAFTEIQEVPKIPPKHLKRLISGLKEQHVWSIDLPRVYGQLLATAYKTMGNILQRKAVEVEKRRMAVARHKRAVGHGFTVEVLLPKDQEDLKELDEVLRKLTLAEMREELMIFILRDLPGNRDIRA